MKLHELINFLICPDDGGELHLETKNIVICSVCDRKFNVVEGIPILSPSKRVDKSKFTYFKWNQYNLPENLQRDDFYYENYYVPDVLKYLSRFSVDRGLFLEIGIGSGFVAKEMAKRGCKSFGIDISFDALLYAKQRFERNGLELGAVCGDITRMPFKDNLFHLIYGGGVIEHISNTEKAVAEQRRCLVQGGKTLQAVPSFSISTMTYGQLWGGVPNFPILKEIFEMFHLRILKGRHMIFGYEKLFTLKQLNEIMILNKLNVLESGVFNVYRPINLIRNSKLKKFANKLMQYRMFCHMIYSCAQK